MQNEFFVVADQIDGELPFVDGKPESLNGYVLPEDFGDLTEKITTDAFKRGHFRPVDTLRVAIRQVATVR